MMKNDPTTMHDRGLERSAARRVRTTRKRMAICVALALIGLYPYHTALGCSSEDRIALAQMGYTTAQIDAQCGSGGNPFVTPSMPIATVCATQWGACYLGEQVPVGNGCWCPTRSGEAVWGVAK